MKQITFVRGFFGRGPERIFGERVVRGGGVKANEAMIQQTQPWRSGTGETAWLSALVATMEQVSGPELRAKPCASSLLAAIEAHLAQTALPHGLYGSNFSLRN